MNILKPFLYLLVEMAPYLLLGFLIAGILHVFVPKNLYRRYLGASNVTSVLLALLFGIPLPLCSCGVIPMAVAMRKEGASKGATSAFLIGTPQTGIDSILATYSVFGLPFAILRPFVALITGLVGGVATNLADPDTSALAPAAATASGAAPQGADHEECSCGHDHHDCSHHHDHSAHDHTHCCCAHNHNAHDHAHCGCAHDHNAHDHAHHSATILGRCKAALDYGFTDMLVDIGQWLLVGIVLAGLITIFVPEDFFTSYAYSGVLNMFIVLLIACPMYVCATGSIPIAAALMLKGLSPGAALVFLMAGPATNMASVMVLGKTLGRRALTAYLLSIVAGAIAAGLVVDNFFPVEWFATVHQHADACCHEETFSLFEWILTGLFIVLLVRALYLKHSGHACSCCEGEGHEAASCSCGHDHTPADACCCGHDHHHNDN